MAPRFDEDGTAAVFGCQFSLRATDDNTIYWLLRPAAVAANKPFEVVKAKYAGLTKVQFDQLLRELSKPGENMGSNSLSNAAHRTQFFDDAFESALGRRPTRKVQQQAVQQNGKVSVAAAHSQQAGTSGASRPHEHSPPSPASKPPVKRVSLGSKGLSELAPSITTLTTLEARAPAGSTKLILKSHVVWLSCNDDRCEHSRFSFLVPNLYISLSNSQMLRLPLRRELGRGWHRSHYSISPDDQRFPTEAIGAP